MATFIIDDSKPSKRCDPRTVKAASIRLGSGSECDLKIRDYVLAPNHCIIFETESGFSIDDLGSGSGTYLDGKPVSKATPLESGSRIVLGTSQFTVEIDPAEKTITLGRDDFQFDRARDPLLWSRSEVPLGRFPALLGANLGAGALCVLFLLVLLPGPEEWRGAILEPGDLHHREIASMDFEGKGCDTCHKTGMERVASKACAECHRDIAGGRRHPYGRWSDYVAEDAPRPIAAAGTLACRDCHVEHREDIFPSGQLKCSPCHGDALPEATLAVAPTPITDVELDYFTFSHAAHAAATSVALQCSDCHRRAEEGEERLMHSEFRRVTFERCGDCHDPARERKIQGKDLPARWHGAAEDGGSRCLQCHSKLYFRDARVIAREVREPARFRVVSRSHLEQAAAHKLDAPARKPCEACHRRGLELEGKNLLEEKPFAHETHLRDLPSAGDCRSCHDAVSQGACLEGISLFDSGTCARTCHAEVQPAPAAARANAAVRRQKDFPHLEHLGVEGGCAACHVLESGSLSPSTPPDVVDCTRCHDRRHDRAGGGSCLHCHVMGPEPAPGDDVVYGNQKRLWRRPTDPGFSHWSRGHAPVTERTGGCAHCHDADGTWKSRTVDAVPIPTEDLPACVSCHRSYEGRVHG